MNFYKIIFAAVAFATLSSCLEVNFKDCGSKSGKPTHVFVEPCEKSSSCILHKGQNTTIKVSFIPNAAITSVKAVCHGKVGAIEIPLEMEGDDGCKDSGLTCPLKEGVEVTYFKAITIKPDFPSFRLQVKWELKDQNNQDIVCVTSHGKIQ